MPRRVTAMTARRKWTIGIVAAVAVGVALVSVVVFRPDGHLPTPDTPSAAPTAPTALGATRKAPKGRQHLRPVP